MWNQSKAMQSKAKKFKAMPGKAKQSKALQCKAKQCKVMQSNFKAMQNKAIQCKPKQCKAKLQKLLNVTPFPCSPKGVAKYFQERLYMFSENKDIPSWGRDGDNF